MTECITQQETNLVLPIVFLISSYVFIWSTVRLFR